jgi:hypothetical protein
LSPSVIAAHTFINRSSRLLALHANRRRLAKIFQHLLQSFL